MFRRAISLSMRNTSSFFRVSSRSFSSVRPFLPKKSVSPSIEKLLQSYGDDFLMIKSADFDGAGTAGDRKRGTHLVLKKSVSKRFEDLKIYNLMDFSKAIISGMGEGKFNHIISILKSLAENDSRIAERYNNSPDLIQQDAKAIHKDFIEHGPGIIYQYATPNPGIPELFKYCRSLGIQCNLQTAYGTAEADAFQKRMAEEGAIFDGRVCGSDVISQRPWPSMLNRLRSNTVPEHFPHQRIVFGDTTKDALAALTAGSWFVGLPAYSALLPNDFETLCIKNQIEARKSIADELAQHGAHYVINPENPEDPNTLTDAMKVILPHIELRMRRGEMPSLLGVIRPAHEETLTDKIENAFRFTR